ncbi:MAG: porin [Gemmobacter sp.]|jgi:outer membrane protein OmpU|nr:porin [Gemmobacter sp.]
MKKILLATTLLASTATVAAAETGVSISGYGRFGVSHNSSRDDVNADMKTTVLHSRLRFNIDGTTETDTGVTFGGRMRFQSTHGGGVIGHAAQLFASYEGFRLEVGNTNGAYDSAGLLYNSEMGFEDTSFGDPQASFYGYSNDGAGIDVIVDPITGEGSGSANGISPGIGLFASYSMGGVTGRISYTTPDQTKSLPADAAEELAVSFDYASGPFSVSLGAAQNGGGIDGNDIYFVGAAYAINDVANVGLNYMDEGDYNGSAAGDNGRTVTLYGNYTMGATTLRAYVANNNNDANATNTAYGLGADYDLGGARLSGSIQKGYAKETVADLGVRFDF